MGLAEWHLGARGESGADAGFLRSLFCWGCPRSPPTMTTATPSLRNIPVPSPLHPGRPTLTPLRTR